MGNTIANFFPPSPKFTEDNVPDQTGKVGAYRHQTRRFSLIKPK